MRLLKTQLYVKLPHANPAMVSFFQVGCLAFPAAAQHSVHPIPDKVRQGHGGGSRRVFKLFSWLEVGSDKIAFIPSHPRAGNANR
jgi:hypothetical protein